MSGSPSPSYSMSVHEDAGSAVATSVVAAAQPEATSANAATSSQSAKSTLFFTVNLSSSSHFD